MNTGELLSHLVSLDVKLWMDGERLRYNAPAGVITPTLREELVSRKAEIIACLQASLPLAEQGLVTGSMPVVPILIMNYADTAPQEWWQAIEALVEIPRFLGPAQLREIVNHLMMHHDGLRLRLAKEQGKYQMFIAPHDENIFLEKDLSGLSEAEQDHTIEALIPELWASLDFTSGPLLRVVFFDLGAQRLPRVLLILHHFATDAYSVTILLEDFQTVCQAILANVPVQLPSKTTSLKQWAALMYNYVQSEAGKAELAYWKSLPWADMQPTPVDHPEVTESAYGYLTGSLSVDETQALLSSIADIDALSVMDALLTACVVAYAKCTRLKVLAIAVLHNGRNAIVEGLDLLRTVGNLYTSYPLLLDVSSDLFQDCPEQALRSVAEHKARIPNEGITWGWLSYYCMDKWAFNWNVIFNYLGQVKPNMPSQQQLFREIQRESNKSETKPYKLTDVAPHTCSPVIQDGQLKVTWEYFSALDDKSSIERLLQEYLSTLRSLIKVTA
jgi:non-ribosomal peptide synthase protein (TIGR01720 family)